MTHLEPHPTACACCLEDGFRCSWIVYDSAPSSAHSPPPPKSCDQCTKRRRACDWPPQTDANGDILVEPLRSNPYVAGPKNETPAARRARVMAWTSKPDKPADFRSHAQWKEDIILWNNGGNTPLPPNATPTPNTNASNTKPRYRPPPKTPKNKPNPPHQPPPRASSPPALNPFVTPFVPPRPKSPPIKIDDTPPPTQKPPTFNSNIIELDQEPSPPVTTPPTPPIKEDIIEEFIRKYCGDVKSIWFAEKMEFAEELRRVGKLTPKVSPPTSFLKLTESMVERLYAHWSVFDYHSSEESKARVDLVREYKRLALQAFIFPEDAESDDCSTSSSDKGKKRAFEQV
ncbi:hypothetical protein DFH28DRAFT_1049177 [Melampsora americana]|nr:hypothetical protein DFH28DRAFT_1049177 [Melampsora americana]